MTLRLLLALIAAVLLAGCGAEGEGSTRQAGLVGSARPAQPPPPPAGTTGPRLLPAPAEERDVPDALAAVVRAWSEALNAGDDEAVGALFAIPAIVEQGGYTIRLTSRALAVEWARGLPCSGELVRLERLGEKAVLAVFTLGDRPGSACDAPAGTLAAAQFLIEDDRIVLWRQVEPPGAEGGTLSRGGQVA
ncbi:MAG: hypothetical protein R3C15_22420 [Thermoleophilia bacterium]